MKSIVRRNNTYWVRKIWWHMRFHNWTILGINRLYTSMITSWKLYQNFLASMSFLKACFQDQYKWKYLILTAKLKCTAYNRGDFRRGSNTIHNLVKCKNKTVITLKPKIYAVLRYHAYLLHTGLDRTEVIIHQHLYWTGLKKAVRKEVRNCGTCQHTIWSI